MWNAGINIKVFNNLLANKNWSPWFFDNVENKSLLMAFSIITSI